VPRENSPQCSLYAAVLIHRLSCSLLGLLARRKFQTSVSVSDIRLYGVQATIAVSHVSQMWICYWVPRYGRGNMRCMKGVYEQYS
jgi:hypothetical protein